MKVKKESSLDKAGPGAKLLVGVAASEPLEYESKSVTILEGEVLTPHLVGGWRIVSVVPSVNRDHVTAYFERARRS